MYIVRADGNAKIGAGHLMRCLTIIEELVRLTGDKEEVLFLCADETSVSLVQEKGFRAESLGTDYRDMESELSGWKTLSERSFKNGSVTEAGIEIAEQGKDCTILVDSYYVTDNYLQALKQYGKVILMDDMQQKAYPVDVIVNYNVFAEEEKYRELYQGSDVQYCIGGKYVPVRPQFFNVEYDVSDRVSDILITTGGGDVDNIAGAILQQIWNKNKRLEQQDKKINFHLITGKFNPHLQELQEMAERHENVHIYHDVRDMAGMMQRCDIAITAGGTTIYELAAIGVPFICFSYAKNQEALTHYIGERGIAYYAGAYHKDAGQVLQQIGRQVLDFCGNREKRNECYLKEKEMIDGAGAKRLACVMYNGI